MFVSRTNLTRRAPPERLPAAAEGGATGIRRGAGRGTKGKTSRAQPVLYHNRLCRASRSAMPNRETVNGSRCEPAGCYPPGLGVKNFSYFPSIPFQSSASSGGGFLRVIFGQLAE